MFEFNNIIKSAILWYLHIVHRMSKKGRFPGYVIFTVYVDICSTNFLPLTLNMGNAVAPLIVLLLHLIEHPLLVEYLDTKYHMDFRNHTCIFWCQCCTMNPTSFVIMRFPYFNINIRYLNLWWRFGLYFDDSFYNNLKYIIINPKWWKVFWPHNDLLLLCKFLQISIMK